MTRLQGRRNIRLAKALESGKYKQGRGALRTGDEFCCLGVACNIAKRATGLEWQIEKAPFASYFDDQSMVVPALVQAYYGWDKQNPVITIGEDSIEAAALNDGPCEEQIKNHEPRTFRQIACGFRRLAKERAGVTE